MQGVSTYGVAVTGVPTAIFAFRDRGDRVVFEGAVVERADIESGSRKCASIDDALSTREDVPIDSTKNKQRSSAYRTS